AVLVHPGTEADTTAVTRARGTAGDTATARRWRDTTWKSTMATTLRPAARLMIVTGVTSGSTATGMNTKPSTPRVIAPGTIRPSVDTAGTSESFVVVGRVNNTAADCVDTSTRK